MGSHSTAFGGGGRRLCLWHSSLHSNVSNRLWWRPEEGLVQLAQPGQIPGKNVNFVALVYVESVIDYQPYFCNISSTPGEAFQWINAVDFVMPNLWSCLTSNMHFGTRRQLLQIGIRDFLSLWQYKVLQKCISRSVIKLKCSYVLTQR